MHSQQSSRNIGNRLFLKPSSGPSMVRLISLGCVFESVCHVSHALLLSGVCQKGLSAEIYPFLPVTEDLSAYGGTPAMCCCINSQASTGLSLVFFTVLFNSQCKSYSYAVLVVFISLSTLYLHPINGQNLWPSINRQFVKYS